MRVLRVALTGGIATGKSYVRERFEHHGVPTVDADELARETIMPGTIGYEAVVQRFGSAIIGDDGAIDRRALGALVFEDTGARRDLEAIVHPRVYAAIEAWFAGLQDDGKAPFGVADIPLLYETGWERDFDIVVVTTCPDAEQIARIMRRDQLSEADARQRIAAQLPLADKRARADFVIDTSGSYDTTDKQADILVDLLRALAASNWHGGRDVSPARRRDVTRPD